MLLKKSEILLPKYLNIILKNSTMFHGKKSLKKIKYFGVGGHEKMLKKHDIRERQDKQF